MGSSNPVETRSARRAPRRTRRRLGRRAGVGWRRGRRRSDPGDHGGRQRRGRGARAPVLEAIGGERRARRRARRRPHGEGREPGDRRPRARGGRGGLALVEAAGLDPRLVQQALRGGWADSRILQGQGTRMIERDFVPGGKVRTLRKDLAMALGRRRRARSRAAPPRERFSESSTGSSSAATATSTAPLSTRSGLRGRTAGPYGRERGRARSVGRDPAPTGRCADGREIRPLQILAPEGDQRRPPTMAR